MESANDQLILQGFGMLLSALGPYVGLGLRQEYGADWWQEAVMGALPQDRKRDLPAAGPDEELMASLDTEQALLLFDMFWSSVFKKRLATDNRAWARELAALAARMRSGAEPGLSDNDAWRGLDTMSRLCEQLDAENAEAIRSLLRQARYGSAQGSTAGAGAVTRPAATGQQALPNRSGLPCWRDVVEPHPDVARGEYRNAEFAADLAQVARGEGAAEYLDPVEFFARTYITAGMEGLLKQALRRVTRKGGEPVIQLKTAFGGGKTHSMLAMYHLLRGKAPLAKIPSLQPLLAAEGLSAPPTAHVAVLVGTALDPSKGKRPPNMPGITVNTIWGELALQLALSAGWPELYDFVREADKKGISPGSEALTRLFDAAGSCLVLLDELVAYARRIYGVNGLPAGSFDNFITFIQEISEAARASKSSLVVASIPESDLEVGGEAGQKALDAIEHTFGRMEAIWKPVAASEAFEVVRRRLFLDCKNPEARDQVCAGFADMYSQNMADFPVEAREFGYRQRLAACYPIHPEIFDRLYEDWATLERFQRTRGVLRLMAAVIHELWMQNDSGLLILPGSLPLDTPAVRDELTRHLPENWNGIVEREVDGKRSVPFMLDRTNPRFGKYSAARRIARSIMLGSAPTVKEQRVRGIEAGRILLGSAQPGDQLAVFNDALGNLRNSLSHLYSNQSGDRYWYDTRPTLRKTVEERAGRIAAADVEDEIEKRLKARCKKMPPLAGVHVCPDASLDVPDEPSARLVVLRPVEAYSQQNADCAALLRGREILEQHGNGPRRYRNMLVFLAADKNALQALEQETRRYLAWISIRRDSQDLNLDAAQNRETENSLQRSSETIDLRLHETWRWLLVPAASRDDLKTLLWEASRLANTGDGLVAAAVDKLIRDEAIISKWAPALLLMELDNLLWRDRDYLDIQTLQDYLCTYLYLPRLAAPEVLLGAIQAGVIKSDEYFAYAAGLSDGRFIDLAYNQNVNVEKSGLVVKREAALKQLVAEAAQKDETPAPAGNGGIVIPDGGNTARPAPGRKDPDTVVPQPEAAPRRFFLSAELNLARIHNDVAQIVDEILNHLASEGSLEISLEVQGHAANGYEQQTVRTASENCNALKIRDFGFERE